MKPRRLALVTAVVLVTTAALGATALHFGTLALKDQIEQALGPNSEIGALHMRWNAVEIEHLRIKATSAWPAADELRADRIVITPDLRGLLSKQIRVSTITIQGAYISMLRSADGKLRLLPSLLDSPKPGHPAAVPPVTLQHVELDDGTTEFFDATVRKPPLRLRMEQLHAEVDDLLLPELKGHTRIDLQGVLKGRRDGKLSVKGWVEIISRDSELTTRLRGVDLVVLEPYLVKAAETGVKKGTLDLDLAAAVKAKHLHAPGAVTLHDLELADGSSTFMGMPRKLVVSMMQDRDRKIAVKFELDGNIDDPKFKLNENLAGRIGSSIASTLGISFEGIAKGAGAVGGTVSGAAQGLGKALKGLFSK